MKPVFKFILGITVLFIALPSKAQHKEEKKRFEHVKERSFSRTYPAAGNSLNIENSFGSVKLNTWNKNEVQVEIHIEVSSTDKEHAEKTFEKIDVTDKLDGKEIKFHTTINKDNDKTYCKGCKTNMSIDYVVNLPASMALKLKNSFGSTEIPDYAGPVSLTSMYGSLNAGKLDRLEYLKVAYGKAELKNLSNSDVNFSYSSIKVESLSGNNKIKLDFCSFSKINLDNSLSSLQIDGSYSTINLIPAANFSATYSISTSYGSVTDNANAGIKRTDTPQKYGPDLNKEYEGKSGSGAAKITIKSKYGSTIIGERTDKNHKNTRKV